MSYILPAVITFIFSLILWQIKKEKLCAIYQLISSEPFPTNKGIGRYFVIKIKNNGNKPINNAEFNITFKEGAIEFFSITQNNMVNVLKQSSSEIISLIPLLNPKENIDITITTSSDNIISTPQILLRSAGLTVEQYDNLSYKYEDLFSKFIIISIFAMVSLSIYTAYNFMDIRLSNIFAKNTISEISENTNEIIAETNTPKDNNNKPVDNSVTPGTTTGNPYLSKSVISNNPYDYPTKEDEIFSILNKADLSYLVPKILIDQSELSYKKTALILAYSFTVDDKKNQQKYINAIEALSRIPGLNPNSKGMIYYLLSRMEQFRDDDNKASYYLDKCKKITPKLYEFLMEQDNSFNLEEISKQLDETMFIEQ